MVRPILPTLLCFPLLVRTSSRLHSRSWENCKVYVGLLLTTESGDLAKLGEARGEKRKGLCFSLSPSLGRSVHKKDEDADLLLCLLWFLGLSEVP